MHNKKLNKPVPKKPKPTIPLLELLAVNATASARKLLQKHGKEDARGYEDLQFKLSDLYADAKDKIAIEKEFAEIHPHKDLILKYLCPPPVPVKTKVILNEPMESAEGSKKIELEPVKQGLSSDDKFLLSMVAVVGMVSLVIYTKKSN